MESKIKKSLENELSKHKFQQSIKIEEIVSEKKRHNIFLKRIPTLTAVALLLVLFSIPLFQQTYQNLVVDTSNDETMEMFIQEDTLERTTADTNVEDMKEEMLTTHEISSPLIEWQNDDYVSTEIIVDKKQLGEKLGEIQDKKTSVHYVVYSIKDSDDIAIMKENVWILYTKNNSYY